MDVFTYDLLHIDIYPHNGKAEALAFLQALKAKGYRPRIIYDREASAYFAGEGRLHSTLRRLTQRLNVEGIPYALLRGLALAEHGYPRLTEDIGLLLTPSGLERFRQRLVGWGYRPAFSGAKKTFHDAETGVRIEIVTSGEYPGDGLPKPVAFPDPTASGVAMEMKIEGICVVTLEKLIELKLASGMSAPHRLRDLADVQDLIVRLKLPLALASQLDSWVQAAYRGLWEKAHAGRPAGSQEE